MNPRPALIVATTFLVFTILASNLVLADKTISQQSSVEQFLNPSYSDDNLFNKNFTIVVLPDTQGYTQLYPWIFDNQTKWIIENIEAMNIIFVTQLGDLVNIPYNITQWENANKSMSLLDGNVAWGVLPGNHDKLDDRFENYSKYFGHNRFNNESWYGGTCPDGDNTNSFQLFSAGGDDYLILHLQYDPSDNVLFWASNVIDQHPDRRVIVSTHDYIQGPIAPDRRSDIGEKIWHSLIKPHSDQIFLVLCGHASTQSTLIDSVNGNVVYQLLADYQNGSNIKSGWLRTLTFCPAHDKICVKTYSPYLKEYKTDPTNDFTIEYDMTGTSIWVFSDFTVSQLIFNRSSNHLSFEISSETNESGYCNVTVLKSLFSGNPWTLTIDDKNWDYSSSENTTHTSIHFECTCSSTAKVVIEGTNSILDYVIYVLLVCVSVALLALLLYRKKHTSQLNQ